MNTMHIELGTSFNNAILMIEAKINEIINTINNLEKDVRLVVEASVVLMADRVQDDISHKMNAEKIPPSADDFL